MILTLARVRWDRIDFGFNQYWYVLAILVVAFVIRNLQGYFDRKRIQEYVEGRGGEIIDITYQRFGPGWLGSSERMPPQFARLACSAVSTGRLILYPWVRQMTERALTPKSHRSGKV